MILQYLLPYSNIIIGIFVYLLGWVLAYGIGLTTMVGGDPDKVDDESLITASLLSMFSWVSFISVLIVYVCVYTEIRNGKSWLVWGKPKN